MHVLLDTHRRQGRRLNVITPGWGTYSYIHVLRDRFIFKLDIYEYTPSTQSTRDIVRDVNELIMCCRNDENHVIYEALDN